MLTDPAAEILEMCKVLEATPKSNNKTHQALAQVFKCSNSADPLFWQILAVAAKRFDTLLEITKTSDAVPEDLRKKSLSAIHHLRQVFSAEHLNDSWDGWKSQTLAPIQLTAIEYLSGLIRNKHPLKKIDMDERSQLINDIDFALENIAASEDESFVRDAVISTLEAIKQILERLEFFGIDALTEQLLLAYSNLSAAETYATREQKSWVKKAKTILANVVAAIVYADIAITAGSHHVERVQAIAQFLSEQLPTEIRALEDLRDDKGNGPNETPKKSTTRETDENDGVDI